MYPRTSTMTQLKRAVTRLLAAEIANQWKGAGDPEHYAEIEEELKAARANYKKHCDGVAAALEEAWVRS